MILDRRNLGALAVAAALAAVVAITVGVNRHLAPPRATTESALAELRALPLIGAVIAEVPDAETRLRAAIEEDRRNPPAPGQQRAFAVIAGLRRTYIQPALAASDDASAADVLAARADLGRHLAKVDAAVCREFAGGGIRRVDKLDTEGQRLFKRVLAATDAAYRSGRTPGAKAATPLDLQAFVALLAEAGFTQSDLQALDDSSKLADTEICALQLRIDTAPTLLSSAKRGSFARFVLTQ